MLPIQPQSLDLLIIARPRSRLLFWLAFRTNSSPAYADPCRGAQALRLSRWGGRRTASDPLVLVLHLGYAWVPIGLLLLGLSVAGVDIRKVPESTR